MKTWEVELTRPSTLVLLVRASDREAAIEAAEQIALEGLDHLGHLIEWEDSDTIDVAGIRLLLPKKEDK